jgi:hypothetical protein
MIKSLAISTILTLSINFSVGQTRQSIDSLLSPLYDMKNSKNLSKKTQAKQIINYGHKVLPILATFFTDTTQTKIKSDCQNIYLTKGEVAIILSDRIEMMPYATLTGIQNCLLSFCKDNPNWIEYYLYAIRRGGTKLFKEKYTSWLASKDRKKWAPHINNKKKKSALAQK